MRGIPNTSQKLILIIGLFMFGSVAVDSVMAAIVTYNFTGTVTNVGGNVSSGPFTAGPPASTMTGTMTVNTLDGNGNPNLGSYQIQSLTITIGGYKASVGPTGTVNIQNGIPGNDRFEVSTPAQPGNLSGPIVNSLAPRLFTINLRGPSSVLTSDALPTTVPSISSFTTANRFRLQFGPTSGVASSVRGVVDTLTAVPLPAGVILFGVGLVALIGLGAGGLRNLRLPQA